MKIKGCDFAWTANATMSYKKDIVSSCFNSFWKSRLDVFLVDITHFVTWTLLSSRVILLNFVKCGWPMRSCKS